MSSANKLSVISIPSDVNTDIADQVFGPEIRGTAIPVESPAPDFSLTLPKAVFELYRFASKDENRHAMQSVEIRQAGDQLAGQFVATATDGHRLCQVTFKAAASDDFGQFPASVLLPAHLLKATKPKGKATVGAVSAIGCEMRIQTGDLVGECQTDCSHLQFPDVSQVIPKVSDGAGCPVAGFNLSYLADLAAMLKGCSPSVAPAISWPSDSDSPLRADADCGDGAALVYVQMPVRLDKK
jgi:hypothetical protein